MQRAKQGHQATGSWHFCSSVTRGGHRQAEGGGGGGRTARARAEAGQHGGEGDGGAEDDGDREDGAVHHGHLGHEEHRLDERDDQGPSVPAPRALSELSARGPCGAGRAMHAATQGAGGQVSGRRDHCRATWWAPALKAVCPLPSGERPKKLGHGRQKKACAGKGGAGQLVRTLNRVPASRSDHQTIGTNIKA